MTNIGQSTTRPQARYFYDIPVYRLTKEKYSRDQEEYIDKRVYGTPFRMECSLRDELASQQRAHLWKNYGGTWLFNEIIGYIRLHFCGTQVRGEYYAVQRKRIVRTRRKQLEYRTWKLAPEREVPSSASSEVIYQLVLEYLDACRKQLKPRYVDTSGFERVGPYINWNALYHAGNLT